MRASDFLDGDTLSYRVVDVFVPTKRPEPVYFPPEGQQVTTARPARSTQKASRIPSAIGRPPSVGRNRKLSPDGDNPFTDLKVATTTKAPAGKTVGFITSALQYSFKEMK